MLLSWFANGTFLFRRKIARFGRRNLKLFDQMACEISRILIGFGLVAGSQSNIRGRTTRGVQRDEYCMGLEGMQKVKFIFDAFLATDENSRMKIIIFEHGFAKGMHARIEINFFRYVDDVFKVFVIFWEHVFEKKRLIQGNAFAIFEAQVQARSVHHRRN